jgi:hypothetical protein
MRMLKMNNLLMMSLVIFLSSCQTLELETEQCSPYFVYVKDEVEKPIAIDIEKSKCFCRPYEFKLSHVGSFGTIITKDINYCEKLVGFPVQQYPHVATFWEQVRKAAVKVENKSLQSNYNP